MKNALLIILAIACLFLYFKGSNKIEKAEKTIAKEEARAEAVVTEAKIISQRIDPEGIQHTVIEADKNKVRASTAPYIGIVDTAAMQLGILSRQVQSLLVVNQKLKAENLRARRSIDSVGRVIYRYRDRYINLAFQTDSLTDSVGTFNFAYDADLQIVQYQKRNWFLGQKKSYIDISNSDKRSTVNGVKQLTVRHESPNYGLRLQGMVTYGLESKNMMAGPAIRFDAGRFSFQGARLYSPNHKPTHAVAVSYDAFRF